MFPQTQMFTVIYTLILRINFIVLKSDPAPSSPRLMSIYKSMDDLSILSLISSAIIDDFRLFALLQNPEVNSFLSQSHTNNIKLSV